MDALEKLVAEFKHTREDCEIAAHYCGVVLEFLEDGRGSVLFPNGQHSGFYEPNLLHAYMMGLNSGKGWEDLMTPDGFNNDRIYKSPECDHGN